jgi:DNA (cytosine-5)-methyltransferase 1
MLSENRTLTPSEKILEAKRRGFFTTVDLFAGCGGMTLGFHRAGFRCIAAVERDPDASCSHIANFSSHASQFGYAHFEDITKTTPDIVARHATGLFADSRDVVDVLIGGPPCQAFSRLGRAALWRIAGTINARKIESLIESSTGTILNFYASHKAHLHQAN